MKRRNFFALAGSSLLVPEYEPVRAYSFIRPPAERPSATPLGEYYIAAIDSVGNKLIWAPNRDGSGRLFTVPADWRGSWQSAIVGQQGVRI